ncbi:MAG TPA: family 10 glycosylhydrolase [Acholeplasma sp.]|jgi:uncharacterized lipoprotein YddW (UPF0748 family)|nr:family 10 glycosylhydrolase [Acholeplasma sp.]
MKLYTFKEPNKPILDWDGNQVVIPKKYHEKPVRAFWVSNVVNIDMPNQLDLKKYKEKLKEIIETAKNYNINTIFFQVRTNNDAYYKSKLNPTSRYLVGKEGDPLLFDPLDWIVKEAHKNNIELHAWCNPYRVSMANHDKDEWLESASDLNLAKRRKDLLVLDTEGLIILNPAKAEVKQHIIDSMMEIIKNYDVDGIHFDDYFYPYKPLHHEHDDIEEYEKRKDKNQSLDDFRERQVDEVIKGVYDAVKAYNPKLQFGVSPFGVWKTNLSDPNGSRNVGGVYESGISQHANSYRWVKEGFIDYIVPQLYWDFAFEKAPFADMTNWWVDLCKGTNVKLYIGHGAYRLGRDGQYEDKMEIVNQVKYANQFKEVQGNIFFTYKTFVQDGPEKEGMLELKKLFNKGR